MDGGGIYARAQLNSYMILNLKNSIVWGNTANVVGGDIFMSKGVSTLLS